MYVDQYQNRSDCTRKGVAMMATTPPFHQIRTTTPHTIDVHKITSWHEQNKLLASPQEARPQGFSLKQPQHGMMHKGEGGWQHRQRQHGEICKKRKTNSSLISNVCNYFNNRSNKLDEEGN
jgi:hypothetical protein